MSEVNRGAGLVGLVLLGPVFIAIVSLVAMLFGAAAGWAGGLIFPQVFDRLTTLIFGEAIPAWQLGAMLGFLATFLRASFPKRK
ncbi:hypothetical protein KUV75_11650 [Qipengyuania gaetbuli]|uniref:Uncharacterized protein n=1 Tax=Qipengyuania gaetbuli TaxID=266952 RepID=A0A844Y450_9SPHN|nr:hypothetical protein [Qipengyuania gaetbuli]MBY6015553.1 hypothetical protein [Qipengyuania gaetbuli]MCA0910426.1 hypothetical protein [Qipengyuania gaetbuli]MXO52187.1 hypothetical protein [Qipengyuania gaetbuli]